MDRLRPDSDTRFPDAQRPARRLIRRASIAAVLAAIAALAIAGWHLREELFTIGPVSPGHARIAGDCRLCHDAPSRRLRARDEAQAAVAFNEACLRCHGRTIGHAADGRTATHHERAPGDGRACTTCHREHEGRSLLPTSDDACVACHRDLRAVSREVDVADRIVTFAAVSAEDARAGLASHPEFRLLAEKRPDPGTLRFNHRRHLMDEKLPGPDGKPARLQCLDCHRSAGAEPLPFRFGAVHDDSPARARAIPRGALMAPIAFASHCAGCHRLSTSATRGRLRGDDAVARDEVPHAAPASIRNYLRSQLGGAAAPIVDEIEASLYRTEGSGCRRCHQVKEASAADRLLAAIVPTAVPARFFPRAAFDHGKHTAAALGEAVAGAPDCLTCHGRALESTRTSDRLLPGVSLCRRCHGPVEGRGTAHGTGGVAARCTTCHTYHVPPPDALGLTPLAEDAGRRASLPSLVAAGLRETRTGLRGSTPLWRLSGFFELPVKAWRRPDIKPGTEAFRREVFARYGLFDADFDNDGLPMGLLRTDRTLDGEPGLTVTCEYCHSSRLFGRVVIGQPNPFCNMERLWDDMSLSTGERGSDPLYAKTPKGNTIVNGADHLGLLGMLLRNDDLSGNVSQAFRWTLNLAAKYQPAFDALAYIKTPPWYDYETRKSGASGLYWDGGQPKDGNFAAYTYLTTFRDLDGRDLAAALAAWKRSGPAFLSSLTGPKYPFPVDAARAARGRPLYDDRCARCHGTYAPDRPPSPDTLSFPGQVYPASEIKTDPKRAHFPELFVERTRAVLKEEYTITDGYAAPPLTSIWARAPYLHNGSVPTLMELLDPPSRRPRFVFAADPDDPADFDQARVGWRVDPVPDEVPPDSLLRLYDPARVPGLTNTGHDYGAELPVELRLDLIEFLKTL